MGTLFNRIHIGVLELVVLNKKDARKLSLDKINKRKKLLLHYLCSSRITCRCFM